MLYERDLESHPRDFAKCYQHAMLFNLPRPVLVCYQARARSARARRACALRALGLLLADGTPTVGGGKTF